jgi:hypothetical protein
MALTSMPIDHTKWTPYQWRAHLYNMVQNLCDRPAEYWYNKKLPYLNGQYTCEEITKTVYGGKWLRMALLYRIADPGNE